MLNKFEKKLKRLEEELEELRIQIDLDRDRMIDEFWDRMADDAEDLAVDNSDKWR